MVCRSSELLHPPKLGTDDPEDVGGQRFAALRPAGRGPSLLGSGGADRGLGSGCSRVSGTSKRRALDSSAPTVPPCCSSHRCRRPAASMGCCTSAKAMAEGRLHVEASCVKELCNPFPILLNPPPNKNTHWGESSRSCVGMLGKSRILETAVSQSCGEPFLGSLCTRTLAPKSSWS